MTIPTFILRNTNRALGTKILNAPKKVGIDLISSFKIADSIKFIYEKGVLKVLAGKKYSDTYKYAEYICNVDFEFLSTELELEVDFCECELLFTNLNWEFQTFVSTMKEGQELEFIWKVDDETTIESLSKNLHLDSLTAILYDGSEHQYHFKLLTYAGSSESGTRMVMLAENSKLLEILEGD